MVGVYFDRTKKCTVFEGRYEDVRKNNLYKLFDFELMKPHIGDFHAQDSEGFSHMFLYDHKDDEKKKKTGLRIMHHVPTDIEWVTSRGTPYIDFVKAPLLREMIVKNRSGMPMIEQCGIEVMVKGDMMVLPVTDVKELYHIIEQLKPVNGYFDAYHKMKEDEMEKLQSIKHQVKDWNEKGALLKGIDDKFEDIAKQVGIDLAQLKEYESDIGKFMKEILGPGIDNIIVKRKEEWEKERRRKTKELLERLNEEYKILLKKSRGHASERLWIDVVGGEKD